MNIAITIPTYNYGARIHLCLDSILQQSDEESEIIIVDDGSTDNTGEVIKQYQKQYPNLIHYYYQTNQGPAKARNFAIHQTQADYILTIDADDILLPNSIAYFREAATNHPNIGIFIAEHYSVLPDGKRKLKKNPILSTEPVQNFKDFLSKKISIVQGAYLLKRGVFEQVQYPTTILGREDLVFIAQILALFPAMTIPKPVVDIIKHTDSLRHQIKQHTGQTQLIEILFDSKRLPIQALKYKKAFTDQLYLSFFRDYYVANDFKTARIWYRRALKSNMMNIFKWNYFKKFIRSIGR